MIALQRTDGFVGRTTNWLYDHLRCLPRYAPSIVGDRVANRQEFTDLEARAIEPRNLGRRIWQRVCGQRVYPTHRLFERAGKALTLGPAMAALDRVASREGAWGNGSLASGEVRETRNGGHATSQKPSYIFVLPWEVHFGGGVNAVVRNLAKAMMEKGFLKPSIAVNSWEDSTPRQSADVFRFRFSIFGSMSALGVLKAIVMAPLLLWHTFRLLQKSNAQAVNFHYPGIAPFGVAVLKRLGLFRGKLVLSYHGTDVAPPRGRLESLIHAFVLRSADHLVACSYSLAERMSSQFAVPASRVDVILNGVDTAVFDGTGRPDTSLPHQVPSTFLVNVGAFIPRKNHTLLLHAFALLKDRYPALHLCIAGADGDERRTVEDAVRAHELSGRAHLFVDLDQFQVALLLSKATLCVQTSFAESFPLAVLEAGASGIPIVVSDIPGHQEMVCNDRTGRLFPLGDPSACANAIAAMLDNPNAAARMAAEQKARARNELTWVSSMQQYERLVRSI